MNFDFRVVHREYTVDTLLLQAFSVPGRVDVANPEQGQDLLHPSERVIFTRHTVLSLIGPSDRCISLLQ
jgi:hypothetical protein